jgi:CDP-glucose 4,6-dehydratase
VEGVGVNGSFWRGKRVFLTGHTGFKGSWLSLWLQRLGAQATGFALAPHACTNLYELSGLASGMQSVIGDIRDVQALSSAVAKADPEIVIHMAAQALVRESYTAPIETYATNVMGTAHLLEAVRKSPNVKAVVIVTTDKCYENREWDWGYREIDPLGGYDPYSNSKACAELVTAAYRSSFFNPAAYGQHGVAIASARAGNVIGGGDWSTDRLIPDILAAMRRGEAASIRNPSAIRPWQHVLEPLSGYLTLAERLAGEDGIRFAEGWNFGPRHADAKPVEWIVRQMIERWGGNASWAHDDARQPHEARYLKLDCSKANDRLGWAPRWDLSTALSAIVEWHRAHDAGRDMRAQTLAQIERFEAAKP